MVERIAVVIGAGGGIGSALVNEMAGKTSFDRIYALSRNPAEPSGRIIASFVNVTDEDSIARAAQSISAPIDLVVIASGILHETGTMPEKALRELDGPTLARLFEVNTIGPALVLKHFAPLLPKDRRAVIAALSARVGSISDNRSGGWYGYRASKAALNMIVRSAAIELARSRPHALCVALHPGTVDTALSQPFQRGISPEKLFAPERAARQLLDVISRLDAAATGRVFAWDGSEIFP